MKLSSLIRFLQKKEYKFELVNFCDKDLTIGGICEDSRKASSGDLFVAIRGLHHDSHGDIKDLKDKISVFVVDESCLISSSDSVFIKVKNTREALSLIASWWFGDPSSKLKLIGVTGTKGKTTTACIVYQVLKANAVPVGLISTIGAKIGSNMIETGLHVSNPEPMLLQGILKKMVDEKIEYVVMEVTSHGIDQSRIFGVSFEVSAITNIAPEHLDYHKTFAEYKKTKLSLFERSKIIVANKCDGSFLDIKKIASKNNTKLVSYCVDDKSADLWISNIKISQTTDFVLHSFSKTHKLSTDVEGKYNLFNYLAGFAVALCLGLDPKEIGRSLEKIDPIEGRMEKAAVHKGAKIYIDFAHTPESMEAVLSHLRSLKPNKLITVFGCAGERDPAKRSKMGRISEHYSDMTVITAEDPRSEKVADIIGRIRKGMKKSHPIKSGFGIENEKLVLGKKYYAVIPDRSEAIVFAVKLAKKGDIIAILGKGHEKSMNYGGVEHPWSDKEAVKYALKLQGSKNAIILAAGRGTRMDIDLPKVLLPIAGKSIISYAIAILRKAGFANIVLVVGYKRRLVMDSIGPSVNYSIQRKMLGTGDAFRCGLKTFCLNNDSVLVLNGDDSVFYPKGLMNKFWETHQRSNAVMSVGSLYKQNPFALGRIVRNETGDLQKIVEEKEATESEKKIREVNIGMYVFDVGWALKNIDSMKKSIVGEYYIVDIPRIALSQNKKVSVFNIQKESFWLGVNTPEQLADADNRMRNRLVNVK